MFFVPAILARKGPLAVVWMAAHMQNKLTKAQVENTDVQEIVRVLSGNGDGAVPISLRITLDLLVGVCYINKRQIEYMIDEAKRNFDQVQLFVSAGATDGAKHRGRPRAIDLPSTRNEAPIHEINMSEVMHIEDWMENFELPGPLEVPVEMEDEAQRRRRITMQEEIPAFQSPDHIAFQDEANKLVDDDNFGERSRFDTIESLDFNNLFGDSDQASVNGEDGQQMLPPQPDGDFTMQEEPQIEPTAGELALQGIRRPADGPLPEMPSPRRARMEGVDEPRTLPQADMHSPPSLVLQPIPPEMQAINRGGRRRVLPRGFGGRPRLPPQRPRRNAVVVIDEVLQLDRDEMAEAIVAPPAFDIVPDTAPLGPGLQDMFAIPLRPLVSRALGDMFRRTIAEAGRNVAIIDEERLLEQRPDEEGGRDGRERRSPPFGGDENADANFFDGPIPPLQHDLLGHPNIGNDDNNEFLLLNDQEHTAEHSTTRPDPRRLQGSARGGDRSFAAHGGVDTFLDDDRTMMADETAVQRCKGALRSLIHPVRFDEFVNQHATLNTRHLAAHLFMDCLEGKDTGSLELEQNSSYQNFNPITIVPLV